MRWSSAAKVPSLIRRRRVGWPTSSAANGLAESMLGVGQQPQLFELVGGEQVGFVDGDHDATAAFVVLGGEQRRWFGG